nr:unnamed protein product [Digitaria exilis]
MDPNGPIPNARRTGAIFSEAQFCLQCRIQSDARFSPTRSIPTPSPVSLASLRSGPEPPDRPSPPPASSSAAGPELRLRSNLRLPRLAPLQPQVAGHRARPPDQPPSPPASDLELLPDPAGPSRDARAGRKSRPPSSAPTRPGSSRRRSRRGRAFRRRRPAAPAWRTRF